MLNLIAEVKIGGRIFREVGSVKVTTSIDEFMDTATLIIPQSQRGEIKEDDEVEIRLGYEDISKNLEFSGFVKEISPSSPYEIRCVDPFVKLRRKRMPRGFHNERIDKVFKTLLSGTGFTARLSPYSANRKNGISLGMTGYLGLTRTVHKAIKDLAREQGYFAYFEGKVLHFLPRSSDAVFAWKGFPLFEQGENIIEHSLLYHEGNTIKRTHVYSQSETGIPTHSYYENNQVKGSELEKSYDVSGLTHDNDCYNRAKELSLQLNAPGYTGDLKSFGYPYVRAGQFCGIQMKGQKKPVIQVVSKTDVSFDSGGFRRTVTPTSAPKDVYDLNKISKQLNSFFYGGG